MRDEFTQWIIKAYDEGMLSQDEIKATLKGKMPECKYLWEEFFDSVTVSQFVRECMQIARDKHPNKMSS